MKKILDKNNIKSHYIICAWLFLVFFAVSCSNKTHEPSKHANKEIQIKFEIDSLSEDKGVMKLLFDDTLKIYASPNDSSLMGILYDDSTTIILKFKPQELESYFDPLYFTSWGEPNNQVIGWGRDLSFRLLEQNNEWSKILFNEKKGLICYLKNYRVFKDDRVENTLFDYITYTWSDYFNPIDKPFHNAKGKVIDYRSSLMTPLINRDSSMVFYDNILGNIVDPNSPKLKDVEGFKCELVDGEWMKVIGHFADDTPYWIRWRKGRKILINYYETWGLE